MNKYELTKSIILTILVLASGVLSWKLWTYESNYETLDKTNYIKEVFISEKAETVEIIKPDNVMYHQHNNHYGTTNDEELDVLMSHLAAWDFYNVQEITNTISDEGFFEFVHGDGKIEISFPTLIPIEQFKEIINIEEKRLPSFEFDKIVIDVTDPASDDGKVNFISYDDRIIYTSNVSADLIVDLLENFYKKSINHSQYFAYDTGERLLFIVDEAPTLMQNKYFLNLLNVDLFKDALFSNPNVVQKTYLTTEDEYTDTSTMMTANYSTRVLSYVNPMEEREIRLNKNDLIDLSVDFLNDHAGWTDEFHLVDVTPQKSIFRLYVNGKPVFNEHGMSEITQIWGDNKIYKYTRPYFTLDILLASETEEITLPDGRSIISYLENETGFNPELLEDLVPAYNLVKDNEEPRIIILEPMWYYQYNNMWGRITMDDLGGETNGLE